MLVYSYNMFLYSTTQTRGDRRVLIITQCTSFKYDRLDETSTITKSTSSTQSSPAMTTRHRATRLGSVAGNFAATNECY